MGFIKLTYFSQESKLYNYFSFLKIKKERQNKKDQTTKIEPAVCLYSWNKKKACKVQFPCKMIESCRVKTQYVLQSERIQELHDW